MTRKDFEGIARVLEYTKPDDLIEPVNPLDDPMMDVWENVVNRMAAYLATTNPAFDRARFLKACGVENV